MAQSRHKVSVLCLSVCFLCRQNNTSWRPESCQECACHGDVAICRPAVCRSPPCDTQRVRLLRTSVSRCVCVAVEREIAPWKRTSGPLVSFKSRPICTQTLDKRHIYSGTVLLPDCHPLGGNEKAIWGKWGIDWNSLFSQ